MIYFHKESKSKDQKFFFFFYFFFFFFLGGGRSGRGVARVSDFLQRIQILKKKSFLGVGDGGAQRIQI